MGFLGGVRREDGGGGPRGDPAGEGGVVVDVEFEEVEERVCYEGDCAVEFCSLKLAGEGLRRIGDFEILRF